MLEAKIMLFSFIPFILFISLTLFISLILHFHFTHLIHFTHFIHFTHLIHIILLFFSIIFWCIQIIAVHRAYILDPCIQEFLFTFFCCLFTIFKHEYLRSRAYTCLSLSSPSSSSYLLKNFAFLSNHGLSRYSCLHLGSLHPRIF